MCHLYREKPLVKYCDAESYLNMSLSFKGAFILGPKLGKSFRWIMNSEGIKNQCSSILWKYSGRLVSGFSGFFSFSWISCPVQTLISAQNENLAAKNSKKIVDYHFWIVGACQCDIKSENKSYGYLGFRVWERKWGSHLMLDLALSFKEVYRTMIK